MKLRAIVFVLAACGGAPKAADPAPPVATAPAFTPTSFTVDVKGHGPAIVLVPGLACPGSVWDGTVAHWGGRYETHVLTLAGFAGQAAMADSSTPSATAADEIIRYIRDRKLDHPIVIGHSMGAFIAYRVAAKAPDLIGKLVAVDGAPAFPGDAAANAKMGAEFRDKLVAGSDADFEQQTRAIFGSMSAHPERMTAIIDAVVRSDKRTFANAFAEMMSTDLRPELPKITAPTLVVVSDGDFGKVIVKMDETIPHHESETLAGTRHFVMIDDPDAFYRVVDAFLAK